MIKLTTAKIMLYVILALIPGIIVLTYIYGFGIILNIFYSVIFAITLETLCLKLLNKAILFYFKDNSAIVTALLFAICLPANFSILKIFIGIFFAIVIAKQVYGGLGQNIFNPAMIGFLVLLITYPQDFTNWQIANTILDYKVLFNIDDISQATPLDPVFTDNSNLLIYYIINTAWLGGGLFLIYKKIIPIVLPLGYIVGIFITSLLISALWGSIYNPIQQLFLGGSMLGAFFIVTDPVTAAATPIGRLIYSILAGVFCILIREYCGYPDGVAFGIVFMNTFVPLINKLTIKKPFGNR